MNINYSVASLLALASFVLGPVFLGRLIKKALKEKDTSAETLILAVLGFFIWLWLNSAFGFLSGR